MVHYRGFTHGGTFCGLPGPDQSFGRINSHVERPGLVFRFLLGVFEGVYYPQQSRFARAWFTDSELSRANSLIHFYGQSLGLGLGYLLLTPIFNMTGWRGLFYITGALGLVVIVPLYWKFLKWKPEFNVQNTASAPAKFSFEEMGGPPVLLLYFITLAFSFCVSSFLPNIWSIIQSSVRPAAVGTAAGVANGCGALGGTVAGFVVGWLYKVTGAYMAGYIYLGVMVMLAGVAVIVHDKYKRPI